MMDLVQVNPLKKRVVRTLNNDSGTYTEKEEPMSWSDAARICLVLMAAQIFMVFLPKYVWGGVTADLSSFCFELFVFSGQTFFANFIAMAGLRAVAK